MSDTNAEANLKRCPSCGGEAGLYRALENPELAAPVVRCFRMCGSTVTGAEGDVNGASAVEAWNRRAPVPTGEAEGREVELIRQMHDLIEGARSRNPADTTRTDDLDKIEAAIMDALASLSPAPRQTVEGEAKQRILGVLDNYATLTPEPDETWESWYRAAFDLARHRIAELLRKGEQS